MSKQTINYIFNITGNANEVINNLVQSAGVLNKNMSQTLNVFGGIKGSAVALQGVVSTIQSVNDAIGGITQAGANAELQLMNLKTLFGGNAEAAEEMYERISEYGKVTPYNKAGLIEAQRTMMSFGIEGEKAFETLKQIGDIAMGDSGKMQSLSLAFAQMSSTGKLTGQDLMQMVNAGFNPLQEISKQTGKSVAELKKEMERGAISVGMVEAAFQSATSEGGLFHNAIAEASETTAGKMAAIQDTIEEVKVAIFNATGDFGLWVDALAQVTLPIAQLSPLFSAVGGAIKWTTKQWNKFRNAVRKGTVNTVFDLSIINTAIVATGAFFKGLATVAKVACKSIGTAIKNIPIIGWIVAVVAAVLSVFKLLWEKSEGFRRLLFGVWEVVKAIVSHLWELLKGLITGIWESVRAFVDTLKGYVSSLWSSIVDGAVWLWEKAVEVATGIGDFFTGIWTWISTSAVSAFDWIVEKLGRVGTWITERLVKPIKQAFTGIWTVIKDVFNKIIDGLGKLFEPIRKLWNKLFPKDAFEKIGNAYRIGAEKGSESWRRDQKEEVDGAFDIENGNINAGILQPDKVKKNGGSNPELSGGNLGSSAGVSAGKAQQVNITLESMVKTMNFNGSLSDNSRDVEQKLRELMARILGMAETAI